VVKQKTGQDSYCHQEVWGPVKGLGLLDDGAVKAVRWQMRCPDAAPVHEGLPCIRSHRVWGAKDQPVAVRPGWSSRASVGKPVPKTEKCAWQRWILREKRCGEGEMMKRRLRRAGTGSVMMSTERGI
jgi:hypothetical protein